MLTIVKGQTNSQAFEKCAELLSGEDKFANVFVVVPDRCSILCEQKLLEKCKNGGAMNFDVVSLNTFFSMILSESENKTISSFGILALVKKIVLENAQKFNTFSKVANKNGFATEIYKTILQLKSSQIGVKDLKNSLEKMPEGLRLKMQDVLLVYEKYEEFLKNNLYDEPSRFENAIKKIENSDIVKSSKFYFLKFESFTNQGYEIAVKLAKKSLGVTIACAFCDDVPNKNIYENSTYTKIVELAKKQKVQFCEIDAGQNDFLKNVYSFSTQSQMFEGNLRLLEFDKEEVEIDFVAKTILKEVRNGASPKDFVLAVPNLQSYAPMIEEVFERYGLLVNIDAPFVLADHSLAKFVVLLCEMLNGDFEKDDVLCFLKNLPIDVNFFDLCSFENYLEKFEISKNKFFDEFKDEVAENFRQKYIAPLKNLYVDFKNAKSFCDFASVVFEGIKIFDIENCAIKEIENFENEQNFKEAQIEKEAFEKINLVINDVVFCTGQSLTKAKDFLDVLKASFLQIKIFANPTFSNAVVVGDAFESFFEKSKFLFVIGAGDGVFPQNIEKAGIVKDDEIDLLGTKFDLSPKISELNAKNLFRTFELVGLSKNLTISYSKSAFGQVYRPSLLMLALQNQTKTKICCINDDFEIVCKEQAKLLFCRNYAEAKKGVQIKNGNEVLALLKIFDCKKNNDFSLKNLKEPGKVFLTKSKISASELNTFALCPYKHFLSYGLRLKEQEKAKIESIDIGNIVHKFCEVFVKNHMQGKRQNAKKVIQQIGNSEEFCDAFNNEANAILREQLLNESEKIVKNLLFQIKNSNFVPTLFENKFAYNLPNCKIEVAGKIDRLDVDKNDAIVLDYKTGDKSFDLSSVFYGTDLQLATYANACKNMGKNFVGAFYFPILNKFEKGFATKLSGFYKGDLLLAKNLDINLKPGCSSEIYAGLKIKLDGNFDGRSKNFSQKEIDALTDYSNKLTENFIKKIQKGYIKNTVAMSKYLPCEKCPYKSNFCSVNPNIRDITKSVGIDAFCKINKGGTKENDNV